MKCTPLLLTCAASAGLACLSLPGCGSQTQARTEPKKPKPVVEVTSPVTQMIADYEYFTGQTMAVKTVEIRARVTGYLDKVNFNDGVEVNENDVLFVIDPRSYAAEVHRAEGTVAQNEAHLARLERDYRRAMGVATKEVLSRQELDKVEGDYTESRGMLEVARAQLENARLNLDFTQVKAPISGRISRRMVDPGNLVRADDTLLTTIVSLDPMYAYFDIDERTLLKLRRLAAEGKIKSRADGNTIRVFVGLSDEGQDAYPHEGEINFTDNRVDASTGTLRVRGVLQNPKPRLLSPGMFARIRLPVGDPHEAMLVPEKSVLTDQGNKYLYLVDREGKIERCNVEAGSLNEGMRVITKGLKKDDRVVVVGGQRVRPGTEVTVKTYINTRTAPESAKAKLAQSATTPAKPS
jgi:RND family efflux transporter MFP subunit